MTSTYRTQHLSLVTTPNREPTNTHPDSIPFPCPTCGAVFSKCDGDTNHLGVTEDKLSCPNDHIWTMRYVSPEWTAGA